MYHFNGGSRYAWHFTHFSLLAIFCKLCSIVSNCIISLKWDKSLKMKIQIFTFLLFGDETVARFLALVTTMVTKVDHGN